MSDTFGPSIHLRAPEGVEAFPLPESGGRAVTLSEYDALADLFLAGSSAMATPPERVRGNASKAPVVNATMDNPAPRTQVQSNARLATVRASLESLNAVASRRVEALIVGHLPVLGAVWIGQYARRVAETLGVPIALLRLHAGQCSLDVIGELSARGHAELASLAGGSLSIERAVEFAGAHVGAWILRTDEPEEIALAEHAGVTDITLLTGADDMALVATYRTLKALATGGTRFADTNAGEASISESEPTLRIAILGATPEKAEMAEAKLARTASTYLGRPVTIVNAGQRISAMPTVTLHRANVATPAARIVESILALGAKSHGAGAGASTSPHAGESSSRIGPARFGGECAVAEPKPLAHVQVPRSPCDLASLFDGMRPLPTRCPYAPLVQFGVDVKGRLHLFAMPEADAAMREVRGEPASAPGSSGRAALSESLAPAQTLAQLVAASGWAFDHLDLLRLASPGFTIAGEACETTLHLLTSEPKSVRRLLDSGVLVHAVLPATVGETTAWVVRDLN